MRSRFYAILTVPVFGVLYAYTSLGVLVVLVLAWMNLRRPITFLQQKWAKSVFIIMGKRLPVEGLGNIDSKARYILVANHSSLFDIVAILTFYPEVSWFGHERLLKIPVFSKILKMTDYIPFRETNYSNTKEMLNRLVSRSGKNSVAIFPEGTRSLDGNINMFYKGFIYLFRSSDTDILPVTLNGFYRLKPKNRMSIDFGSRLSVHVHKPVSRKELEGLTDNEIIEKVRDVIKSKYK